MNNEGNEVKLFPDGSTEGIFKTDKLVHRFGSGNNFQNKNKWV